MRKTMMMAAALAALGAGMPAMAQDAAAPPLNCPLRDVPYSLDTPLLDILLDPAAKDVVAQHAPSLLTALPPRFSGTTVPTFAAIMPLRDLLGMSGKSEAEIAALDQALGAVEISDQAKAARCARYDDDPLDVVLPEGAPRILLFDKITGFRDDPSVKAGRAMFVDLARKNGWTLVSTDRGGAMRPETLEQFDVVIWNNVSGDVLTMEQRAAFKAYVENGGAFLGVHGSAGDHSYYWDWYVDDLLGARFIGHSMNPQFQEAQVEMEDKSFAKAAGMSTEWALKEEWYSFAASPRVEGANIVATIDESSYQPGNMMGRDLAMGDHPVAWTRCVGDGRMFYSSIGHMPENYADEHVAALYAQAVRWAMDEGSCDN